MDGTRSELIFRSVCIQADQVCIRPLVQSGRMAVGYRALGDQGRLKRVFIWLGYGRTQSRRTGSPKHELKLRFRVRAPRQEPITDGGLDDFSRVFSRRDRNVHFLRARRGKSCQTEVCWTMTRGQDNISGTDLSAGVTNCAVIAAIGLDSAAVGIHRINFRNSLGSKRVGSFEQNASIAEHVG